MQNDHTVEYFKIINRYQQCQQHITKKSQLLGYYEKHHIIPKSMGGSNFKDNIVYLSAEDHLMCHKLLIEMTEDADKGKMWSGLWRMMNKQSKNQDRNFTFTENEYLQARKNHAEVHRKRMLENNPFKNKKHTLATKEKMSNAKKGKSWEEIYGLEGAKLKKIKTSIAASRPHGPQIIVTCEYCGKSGGVGIMKRWHGDRCKHNLQELAQ